MLAVFPEDTEVPLVVVGQLWGTDEVETEEAVTELAAWHLIEVEWEWRTRKRVTHLGTDREVRVPPSLSLIDLHLDYLRASAKDDLAGWHRALLRTCEESKIDKYLSHKIKSHLDPRPYWTREHLLHHLRGCEGSESVTRPRPKADGPRPE